MKILLISDIHANLEALQAIDEDRDAVLCMRDLVDYGPSPKECIAELWLMGAVIVRGNHDNAVAFQQDCRCHGDYKLLSVATRQLTWQLLEPSEIEFLRQFPLTETVELAGTRFFLCHAAPSDPLFRYLPSSASDDQWESEVEGIKADFFLVGHTHEAYRKRVGNKWVINPGSVGQPKGGRPLVSYAVWQDGEIVHKQVPYDFRRTMERIDETKLESKIKSRLKHILAFGALA